jgi:hypothetical protein
VLGCRRWRDPLFRDLRFGGTFTLRSDIPTTAQRRPPRAAAMTRVGMIEAKSEVREAKVSTWQDATRSAHVIPHSTVARLVADRFAREAHHRHVPLPRNELKIAEVRARIRATLAGAFSRCLARGGFQTAQVVRGTAAIRAGKAAFHAHAPAQRLSCRSPIRSWRRRCC